MRRLFLFAFFLFGLALVPAFVAFGQEAAAPSNQMAFFWDVRIGTPAENAQYAEMIARSALVSFEQKGFKPVPGGELAAAVPGFDRGRPLEETAVPRLAELSGAQGSLFFALISYYGEDSNFTLEIIAWDKNGKRFFESKKEKARSGLELINRLNEAVSELAARAGKLAQVEPDRGGKTQERTAKGYVQQIIVLSGDEGAEVFINSVIRAGVITGGRLTLPFMPLNLGSKLVIEKRKEGYYNDVEEFRLDEEWLEVPLRPMEKRTNQEASFIYTVGQFIGFGLGYHFYLIPRMLSLGGENYFYLQTSETLGSHLVIHDDLRFLVGLSLLSSPGVPFKVGVSTGVGCIFTLFTIPPNPLFFDFYFNLLNISVEFRVWEITFFVREEIKLGIPIANNLLGGGFYMIRGEIPIFSFGVKLAL